MKRGNKYLLFMLSYVLLFSLTACDNELKESAKKSDPVIDFKVTQGNESVNDNFSSLLLRAQILNTDGDILKYGITTPEEHQARLNYYLSAFRNDVLLISGLDTIPCFDVHFERTYMAIPYMNFILTFQHQVNTEDHLIITDKIYSGLTLLVPIEENTHEE